MDLSASPVFDAYPTRCMLGLVASLTLLIALVHFPVQRSSPEIGWTTDSSADRITLSEVVPEEYSDTGADPPSERAPRPTSAGSSADAKSETQSDAEAASENDNSIPDDSDPGAEREEVRYANTLGITDRAPQIVGGKGSLYLNINYPERAREQGVEGRLVLEFLVEADGSVTDIEVAKSLHPLCDSAAVNGIRSVEFIPAKLDGDPVPIRLRLPVRFELSTITTATQTDRSTP